MVGSISKMPRARRRLLLDANTRMHGMLLARRCRHCVVGLLLLVPLGLLLSLSRQLPPLRRVDGLNHRLACA